MTVVGTWYFFDGTLTQSQGGKFSSWIAWRVASQSIDDNTSTVEIRSLIRTTSTLNTWNGTCSLYVVKLDGATVYNPGNFNSNTTGSGTGAGWTYTSGEMIGSGVAAENIPEQLVLTHSYVVTHNADGTKSLRIQNSYSLNSGGWGPGDVNLDSTVALPTIPRARTRIKVGGAWVTSNQMFVKVGGSWHQAKALYVKVGGSWQRAV